jgi:lipid-A-disaccharide synthase-like uncharacterized protein
MIPTIPLQAGAVGLLGLVFFALFLYMVFWVYTDAQKNSEHPAFLWAVVVFLAPLLGLVLYFVLGRNRRGGGSYGQGY